MIRRSEHPQIAVIAQALAAIAAAPPPREDDYIFVGNPEPLEAPRLIESEGPGSYGLKAQRQSSNSIWTGRPRPRRR